MRVSPFTLVNIWGRERAGDEKKDRWGLLEGGGLCRDRVTVTHYNISPDRCIDKEHSTLDSAVMEREQVPIPTYQLSKSGRHHNKIL